MVKFNVEGAGFIGIREGANCVTGEVAGLNFSVSWGKYPYCGGVLGISEARKLAAFLIEQCDKQTKSESDIVRDTYAGLKTS